MTIDKERLRALAEAATPGPWGTIDRGPFWGESEGDVIDHYGADVVGAEHVAPLGTQETTRGQMWLRDAEFIAAARDAIPALLSENAAKDKQLAAYATLVKSIEERMRLASNEHAKAIEARDSLQSERDANSILTTENAALIEELRISRQSEAEAWRYHPELEAERAALAAEVERLRKDAGHTEPMTRFCPGCGSVGDVPKKYRNCCPDGSDSRVIPEKLAKQCHDLFQGALQAAMADKGGAP